MKYELKGGGKIPKYLVDELKKVDGLICSLVYGSLARGEEGGTSDIDILNIFKDKESLDNSNLTELVFSSEVDRVVQFVNMTIEEVREGKNDSLVSSAFHDGEILFLKNPLRFEAQNVFREHSFSIITYDLRGLENKEKVKFLYILYGKGKNYKGILDEYPGEKIGKGAILIEKKGAKKVIEVCKKIGVDYEERKVWL